MTQIGAMLGSGLTDAVTASGTGTSASPKKIQEAATQFEAILIDKMLQSAQCSGEGGWTGGDEDDNSALTSFAQQQFAQALAAQGGFGIAKMVLAGLSKHAD